MRPKASRPAWRSLSLGLALCAGCGGRGLVGTERNGDGSVEHETAEVPAAALRAFDVIAGLRARPDGGTVPAALPSSVRFTVVLDADASRIIAGGQGTGTVVLVTSTDGSTFAATSSFDVDLPPQGTCGDTSRVTFKDFDFTVGGDAFRGHAGGLVGISCGDCFFTVPFVADVEGAVDATAPTLVAAVGDVGPFDPVSVLASEPLPGDVTARLVDPAGFALALDPIVHDGGAVPVVVGFTSPNVVLGTGGGYAIELGGLVDFSGRRAPGGAPLRVGSFPVPPLVPPDGFESATGKMLGGAAIVRASSSVTDLAPITGAQSVYLGSLSAPIAGQPGISPRLLVRLAVPVGATAIRFSYRVVSPLRTGLVASVSFGSVGKSPHRDSAAELGTTPTPIGLSGGPGVLGGVETKALPLPADHTDEIIFELSAFASDCGPEMLSGGLLVDDLRVE
jgi:hypothetical protein